MNKISNKKANKGNKTNFWQGLKKPLFVMAPMANVTDVAFRSMFAKYGKPTVMWTEFVSADGLCSKGRKNLEKDLEFYENERPIVAQLFGSNISKMKSAASLVEELGFDGLDLNMGCPDRSIEKQGSGAHHIKDPEHAIEIIKSAREGAKNIPVSVKTRIGYNKIEIDTWIRTLLEQKLPVLTVHLRTRKEMSNVPAHWELMPIIVKMRNEISKETLIIGNGDINSIDEAKKKIQETGCDGVMIGRGIFGNPWFFSNKNIKDITIKERLTVMLEHAKAFNKYLGKIKNFAIMKKHFKAYVSEFDGAKELRIKLMESNGLKEVEKIVKDYIKML